MTARHLALLALAACNPPPPDREPPHPGYAVVDVFQGGTITGTVRWVGAPPDLAPLPVTRDTDVCGASKADRRLVVGGAGGVADTHVYLANITAGRAPVARNASIVQHHCEASPHVQLMAAGSLLVIRNEDPMLHEPRGSRGAASVFDFPQPIRGQRSEQKIDDPGTIVIGSALGETWMTAIVHVTSHPYAALTDDNGRFALEGVPAGTYRLALWHEGWRDNNPVSQTREVTVAAGETVPIDFTLSR